MRKKYIIQLKKNSFKCWDQSAIEGYKKAIEILENHINDEEFINGFYTASASIALKKMEL